MLGLAQLYQIRGRVGRCDVTAHAYLFYPDARELTAEARARLATLADHTELGAGFAIAMRDLEIRGAGELLGAEQSGHVAAVGFELYVELLDEAVAELQGQRRVAARPVRIDARIDAYVPQQYVGSEALRIDIHRRLALAETEDELRELQAALEDRYGPLPEPVENLFAIQEAKIKVALLGADYLVFRGGKATVGRLVLGSAELKELRSRIHTAVYAVGNNEVSLRSEDGFPQALRLVDAILEAVRREPASRPFRMTKRSFSFSSWSVSIAAGGLRRSSGESTRASRWTAVAGRRQRHDLERFGTFGWHRAGRRLQGAQDRIPEAWDDAVQVASGSGHHVPVEREEFDQREAISA